MSLLEQFERKISCWSAGVLFCFLLRLNEQMDEFVFEFLLVSFFDR